MKLQATNKEIPAAFELIEQLRPGLSLTAERDAMKGLSVVMSTTLKKTLADGTVFELELEITP